MQASIHVSNAPEVRYLLGRRKALGGQIPKRVIQVRKRLDLPAPGAFPLSEKSEA